MFNNHRTAKSTLQSDIFLLSKSTCFYPHGARDSFRPKKRRKSKINITAVGRGNIIIMQLIQKLLSGKAITDSQPTRRGLHLLQKEQCLQA